MTGLSPHTRGALERVRQRYVELGDHPRIRGEHLLGLYPLAPTQGIIPAYAGSTAPAATVTREPAGSSPHTRGARLGLDGVAGGHRDHPRIRGEHSAQCLGAVVRLGIIPAYAGSTGTSDAGSDLGRGSSPHTRGALELGHQGIGLAEDHPRIRGEHRDLVRLVRGGQGIIPAYAGSTTPSSWFTLGWMGSSPHTRGAPA